jgi:hypothetical protein
VAPYAIQSLSDASTLMQVCKALLFSGTHSKSFWNRFLQLVISARITWFRLHNAEVLAEVLLERYQLWPSAVWDVKLLQIVKSKFLFEAFPLSFPNAKSISKEAESQYTVSERRYQASKVQVEDSSFTYQETTESFAVRGKFLAFVIDYSVAGLTERVYNGRSMWSELRCGVTLKGAKSSRLNCWHRIEIWDIAHSKNRFHYFGRFALPSRSGIKTVLASECLNGTLVFAGKVYRNVRAFNLGERFLYFDFLYFLFYFFNVPKQAPKTVQLYPIWTVRKWRLKFLSDDIWCSPFVDEAG